MKRTVLMLTVAAMLVVGCGNAQKKAETAEKAAEITLTEMTPLVDIANTPDDFVGKQVLVEGTVDGRCMGSGCWISIKTDDMEKSLIVTTPDESYVFPEESMGKVVEVQGVWTLKNAEEIEAHEKAAEGEDHTCPNPVYYLNIEAMKIKA